MMKSGHSFVFDPTQIICGRVCKFQRSPDFKQINLIKLRFIANQNVFMKMSPHKNNTCFLSAAGDFFQLNVRYPKQFIYTQYSNILLLYKKT